MKEIIGWLTSRTSFRVGVPEFSIEGPLFVVIPVVICFLISLGWISRDARQRGKSSFAAIMFAIIAVWPLSLLWWRWLRPPLLPPR